VCVSVGRLAPDQDSSSDRTATYPFSDGGDPRLPALSPKQSVDTRPAARIYSRWAKKFALRAMPKLTTVDLTRRESQIMEILYRRRRATVEEIRSELPDAPSPSSVRKLLDIMIERGLLAREYDGPRYVYFPAVKPEEASRSALKQLVRTFFDNSTGSAMAALLDMTSTRLSAAEYRRLSRLLERVREQGDEP
jgi:BlaI family transcriptional regulator, penicillinase repressor